MGCVLSCYICCVCCCAGIMNGPNNTENNLNDNQVRNVLGSLTGTQSFDPSKHINESECTICLNEYVAGEKVVVLKCDPKHFFHESCI